MEKKYYVIFGAQMVNKGAQAMLFVTASEIRKRDPEAKIIVFVNDKWKSEESPDIYNMKFVPITMKHIMNLSKSFLGKVYVIGKRAKISPKSPGLAMIEQILKNAKMAIDISGYAFSNQWSMGNSMFYLSKYALLKQYEVPTYILPQSFGPLDYHSFWKNLVIHNYAKKCLQYPVKIFAREKEGYDCLVNELGLKNVELSHDLVLQSQSININDVYKYTPTFRKINVEKNSVAIIPNSSNNKYGNKEQLLDLYSKMIAQLQELGKKVYLLSHSSQDFQLCKEILESSKNCQNIMLVDEDLSCIEYGNFIKNFDYVIASRFHSIVNAYKENIPCIALGWATKYEDLLSLVEQKEFNFDVRTIESFDRILAALSEMDKSYKLQSDKIRLHMSEIQRKTCFEFLDCGQKQNTGSKKNVLCIVENQLCTGCGICKAICGENCIEYKKIEGNYIPVIDENVCIQCGKCLRVCPGKGFDYQKEWKDNIPENKLVGNYIESYSAYSKNKEVLNKSTSGGCVTEIVGNLLSMKMYDAAFCVKSHAYDQQAVSECITSIDQLEGISKSRYVPIAHTAAIEYILSNPEKKVVFVGTSCFMHGLLNIIRSYNLNRDNYLLLGLFCDRTLNYHIWDYFSEEYCAGQLKELYFRDKEHGGWPGNVTLIRKNDKIEYKPSNVRTDVKDYFQLSSCLFCYDKLNQFADISFGDDYGNRTKAKECNGRNSVIIRSNLGKEVWEKVSLNLNVELEPMSVIEKSQNLHLRRKNNTFSTLEASVCDGNTGFSDFSYDYSAIKEYENRKHKISLSKHQTYDVIKKEIREKKRKQLLIRVKRKIGKLIRG